MFRQEVQSMEPFISAAKDINVEEIMAAIRKKIQDKIGRAHV